MIPVLILPKITAYKIISGVNIYPVGVNESSKTVSLTTG